MLETAIDAAEAAGSVVERHFEKFGELERTVKDNKSFVTKADKESEEIIKALILGRFPDHGVIGEEGSEVNTNSEYQWVIDPIDGTMNFVHGIPLYSISIAVLHKGVPIVGVVYCPPTRSLYTAEAGKGMFFNGKEVSVSKESSDTALFVTGHAPQEKELTRKILATYGPYIRASRVLSACSLELAYVASGTLAGYICIGMNKWDYAAGWLMIQEAGGKITDFKGAVCSFEENHFIASNGVVHEALMSVLKAAQTA